MDLKKKYSTPLYIYDVNHLKNNIRGYLDYFKCDDFDTEVLYASKALNVNYCNALSAGDAMVAAFAYGISKNMDIIDIFKLSIACSAATVETKGSKPADLQRIKELLNDVSVEIMDYLQ